MEYMYMYVCVYRNIFFCIIQLGGIFLQVSFEILIILFPRAFFKHFAVAGLEARVFRGFLVSGVFDSKSFTPHTHSHTHTSITTITASPWGPPGVTTASRSHISIFLFSHSTSEESCVSTQSNLLLFLFIVFIISRYRHAILTYRINHEAWWNYIYPNFALRFLNAVPIYSLHF